MKKSFGQHFLKDESIAKKIVDAAEIQEKDLVVEVGPGAGFLTKDIVSRADNLILIEADRDLIPNLEKKFSQTQIIQNDAAQVDYDEITKNRPWKFISNLPYNAGNAIIMKALSAKNPPRKMIIMVQKEVAERMVASAGEMSLLSVAVQIYTNPKIIFDVKPESFVPPPAVTSSVLVLDFNKKSENPEAIIKLAKFGFLARRKQLHKNLSAARIAPSTKIKEILLSLELSEKSRAQELGVMDWVTLQSLL